MNSPELVVHADVQNETDHRGILINQVGISDLKYPVWLGRDGNIIEQSCSANWQMTVELSASKKGTHMSRFIEILEQFRGQKFTYHLAQKIFAKMLERLHAIHGKIDVGFEFFVDKKAPVSHTLSLLDYVGGYSISKFTNSEGVEQNLNKVWVKVPVTSLCPCSKKISNYGAHNQRSQISISVATKDDVSDFSFSKLVNIAEEEASCQLYGVLKRPDEKYITEYAYDHPKFVEDLVRDMVLRLKKISEVASYEVIAQNYESIHNHTAYALVRG